MGKKKVPAAKVSETTPTAAPVAPPPRATIAELRAEREALFARYAARLPSRTVRLREIAIELAAIEEAHTR